MIERDREMMIKVDHLGDQVLDLGGIVNVRKMQNGNQEAVMMMDPQDEILTANLHPEDRMMLVIGAENLEMIVVLVTGMIEEVIEVVTIGVLVHLEEEIGAEPVMLLEEMIVVEVDSVEEVIEIEVVIEIVVVIAEPMIGDPLPVFCLQQEMIDEMIAVIDEMIVVVIVEMILHRSRLPNVIKVGRKPPMVGMVG